ncbi:MAG: hypothetical protein M3123_03140 [Actinomycetota bacterium]|nr:hypothetical protein [Actinomycetota bacterium]
MSRLAIRCDPGTSVATEEVESWLQRELERFRAAAPHASIHLHRLTETKSTAETGDGWLIELDSGYEQDPVDRDRLAAALRDMRLLGLRPTLLGALENGGPLDLARSGNPIGKTV